MDDSHSNVAVITAPTQPKKAYKKNPKVLPPFNVVLLDDDDHTYEYVILMLQRLFGHTMQQAFTLACTVDTTGRAIVDTTTKERAELKRDQIHSFGGDPRIPRCAGGMSALIEPCPR